MLDALLAEARLRWGLDPAAGLAVIAAERLVSAWAAEGGIEAGLPRLHIPAATPAGRQPRQDPLFSAALAIRGFRTVELDGISLRRQIALMRGARFLVVEGGPTSASVFFAPSHCRVLEIFDPRNVQPMVWSAAAVSGLQYGYQVGALERPGGDNFVVGTQMVSWTLDRMLLDIAPPQPAAAHAFRA